MSTTMTFIQVPGSFSQVPVTHTLYPPFSSRRCFIQRNLSHRHGIANGSLQTNFFILPKTRSPIFLCPKMQDKLSEHIDLLKFEEGCHKVTLAVPGEAPEHYDITEEFPENCRLVEDAVETMMKDFDFLSIVNTLDTLVDLIEVAYSASTATKHAAEIGLLQKLLADIVVEIKTLTGEMRGCALDMGDRLQDGFLFLSERETEKALNEFTDTLDIEDLEAKFRKLADLTDTLFDGLKKTAADMENSVAAIDANARILRNRCSDLRMRLQDNVSFAKESQGKLERLTKESAEAYNDYVRTVYQERTKKAISYVTEFCKLGPIGMTISRLHATSKASSKKKQDTVDITKSAKAEEHYQTLLNLRKKQIEIVTDTIVEVQRVTGSIKICEERIDANKQAEALITMALYGTCVAMTQLSQGQDFWSYLKVWITDIASSENLKIYAEVAADSVEGGDSEFFEDPDFMKEGIKAAAQWKAMSKVCGTLTALAKKTFEKTVENIATPHSSRSNAARTLDLYRTIDDFLQSEKRAKAVRMGEKEGAVSYDPGAFAVDA